MSHEEQSEVITSIASLVSTDLSCKDDVKSEPVIQINSTGYDYMLKVRKPYTITKQREKWTEEEHQKFLEALKLYGRGWCQIEEHIGTKTAVQIRSHAQKFFCKVVRGSSGCTEGTMKSIEIPPPRPKRKPLYPYPRKLNDNIKGSTSNQLERSPSPNLTIAEKGTRSPTSVLSTMDSERVGSAASDQRNKSPCSTSCMTDMHSISPCQIKKENYHMTSNTIAEEDKVFLPTIQLSTSARLENFLSMKSESGCKDHKCPEGEATNFSPSTSIKLFGRTVLVLDSQKESLLGTENTNLHMPSDNQIDFPLKDGILDPVLSSDNLDTKLSPGSNVSCWNPSVSGFSVGNSEHQKKDPSSSEGAPVLCWPFFQVPFCHLTEYNQNSTRTPLNPLGAERMKGEDNPRERYCTDSNEGLAVELENPQEKNIEVVDSSCQESEPQLHRSIGPCNSEKGFVPYKRCLAERNIG